MPATSDVDAAAAERGAAATAEGGRKRDFWLLVGGFSFSTTGSRISTIAYPLLVLAITHSPADAGWTGFAAIAPSILIYLPAGELVDRLAPRRMMLASELGRGAVIAAVIAALTLGRPRAWELALAAAAEQFFRVFAELAERRLTSSLLQCDQEASGLARSETWNHTAVLVGRPLGAFLFGLGRSLPFWADVASVAISIAALLRIKAGRIFRDPGREHADRRKRQPGRIARQGIGEAMQWLRADPFAQLATQITAGTTFIGQALIMIFLIDAQSQHLPALEIGLVLGASGVGGAVGSAAASWFFSRVRYALLHRQMWVWALALALLGVSGGQSLIGMALAMAALGFTGALGNVAVDTYLVRASGGKMFARLVSIDRVTSLCALALGPLAGGTVMQVLGMQRAIYLLFFMTALLTVAAFREPSMRSGTVQPPFAVRAVRPPAPAGLAAPDGGRGTERATESSRTASRACLEPMGQSRGHRHPAIITRS